MAIPPIKVILNDYQVTVSQVPQGDIYIANGVFDVQKLKHDDLYPQKAGIPEADGTLTATKVGGPPANVSGTYHIAVRYLDDDGIPGNLSDPTTFVCTNTQMINYANIPVAGVSYPRVTKKQIWRTTAGETNVFYLDVDDIPAANTLATSVNKDTQLQASTSMSLLNPDGTLNARRFGVPPDSKMIVVTHQDRTFFVGERILSEGMISLTSGSVTASIVGSNLSTNVEGREISFPGHTNTYTINSWVGGNIINLDTAFTGPSDRFSRFEIKTSTIELNRMYFSERGEPESVPTINAVDLLREQSDEGFITAAMPMGAFLWIMTQSRIYRWTYQVHPINDGNIYQTAPRGCLNQRCWTLVEGNAYIMDHQGCYRFNGGIADPISGPIQDLFRPGGGILWDYSKWFHVSHNYGEETVKFFVCLDGSTKPRHALCYHIRTGTWWVEQYPWFICSSEVVTIRDGSRMIVGSEHNTVMNTSIGTLDGPKAPLETRPTVSNIRCTKLTISGQYTASDITHAPITIARGRGAGQTRRITYVDSNDTVYLDSPWHINPDSESEIQIGGVNWSIKTKNYRLRSDETDAARRVSVSYATPKFPAELNISIYYDRSDQPSLSAIDYDRGDNVVATIGSPYVVVDMYENDTGWSYWSVDGMRDYRGPANRTIGVGLSGVQNKDLISLYDVSISGVE